MAPTAGDLDAFCLAQHARLVGALGLYCGDRGLAEDLTQEALIRLCRHWHHFDTDFDAQRWVTRVAFNLAKSSFRSRATRRRIIDRFGASLAGSDEPSDTTTQLAVRAAVAALGERERRVIILRYFTDLPVQEVAEVMNCPPGTVKTLTRQAIARLRLAGLEVTDG